MTEPPGPSATVVVPRTPGIFVPPRDWITEMSIPAPRGKATVWSDFLGWTGVQAPPESARALKGDLVLNYYGVLFLTTGERPSELRDFGRELIEHAATHVAAEVTGPVALVLAGLAAGNPLAGPYGKRQARLQLANPDTMVIPLPLIVNSASVQIHTPRSGLLKRNKERRILEITAEQAPGKYGVCRFWREETYEEKGLTDRLADGIWLARFLYEEGLLLATMLEKLLPHVAEENRPKVMAQFMQAYFLGPDDYFADRSQPWKLVVNQVYASITTPKPGEASMNVADIWAREALYHLQRFKKCPCLASNPMWKVIESYRPTCLQCDEELPAGARICSYCGSPLY